MGSTSDDEREIRAARNQTMFRAVNEKARQLNDALGEITGSYTIACECANADCVDGVEITPEDYERVRSRPNSFVVLTHHVVPEVERVIDQVDGYAVVEKLGAGAEIAEITDPRRG